MLAILIPVLLVGAAIAAIRARAPERVSALQTFCAFLRDGQPPPIFVCDLARREAISIGDTELADTIALVMRPAAPVFSPSQVPATGLASSPPTPAPVPVASPIAGVADAAWNELCCTLANDSPDHDSARRVGKYNASKTRLEQIGIEPALIVGSSDAQDDALCTDLADAHHQLDERGVLKRYIGKTIQIPDMEHPSAISLSGVLGVVSVAGIDGASKWLVHPSDRKRFPHTTNVFLRTNGIF